MQSSLTMIQLPQSHHNSSRLVQLGQICARGQVWWQVSARAQHALRPSALSSQAPTRMMIMLVLSRPSGGMGLLKRRRGLRRISGWAEVPSGFARRLVCGCVCLECRENQRVWMARNR
jgi:hypothetical protein